MISAKVKSIIMVITLALSALGLSACGSSSLSSDAAIISSFKAFCSNQSDSNFDRYERGADVFAGGDKPIPDIVEGFNCGALNDTVVVTLNIVNSAPNLRKVISEAEGKNQEMDCYVEGRTWFVDVEPEYGFATNGGNGALAVEYEVGGKIDKNTLNGGCGN